jgi:hypothetical protein
MVLTAVKQPNVRTVRSDGSARDRAKLMKAYYFDTEVYAMSGRGAAAKIEND